MVAVGRVRATVWVVLTGNFDCEFHHTGLARRNVGRGRSIHGHGGCIIRGIIGRGGGGLHGLRGDHGRAVRILHAKCGRCMAAHFTHVIAPECLSCAGSGSAIGKDLIIVPGRRRNAILQGISDGLDIVASRKGFAGGRIAHCDCLVEGGAIFRRPLIGFCVSRSVFRHDIERHIFR